MTDDDWDALHAHRQEVHDAPLIIDVTPNLTALDVRTKARRVKQKQGLSMVVVDYLQLMGSGGRRAENRQLEVSDISRSLKLLAVELDVPVIALSQLNRGPEQRADKKAALSDLRESGAIENDADMVILIHREDAYDRESPRSGEADLIVAKHRGGALTTITVASQLHKSRFRDMGSTD
jgi:replicative DNA helicase